MHCNNTPHSRRLCLAIIWKHDTDILDKKKLEIDIVGSIALSSEADQATATGNKRGKCGKVWTGDFWDTRADGVRIATLRKTAMVIGHSVVNSLEI